MLPHLRAATFKALILTTIILSVQSQDEEKPTFPKLKELGAILYQTEVQVTVLDQQGVAYATEYHDADISSTTRGRVDVMALGTKLSIYYYKDEDSDELIQIDSKNGCKGGNVGDSLYDYQPIFYGWLNKDPLIIGPSAPLWMAQKYLDKIVLDEGEFEIRDILCNKFSLNYTTDRDYVTYNFYFAVKKWTTPYAMDNLRVPIRIEVIGNSSREAQDKDAFYPINQYTDFSYFRPDVEDWRVFQIPEGIGCFYRNASDKMPKMPKVYQYAAEVVDLLKNEETDKSDIEFQRVWYDGKEQLARLDKYTKLRSVSELYDFNTGVTYSMVDGRTCDIKPLRNSFFEGYDGQMIGHLKEPGEVLGLDNKFYYVGKKLIRGIWSDVFETVVTKVTFMKKALEKLVITIYYSQEYYEVAIDGDTETRVPVYYAVKGWDDQNKVVLNLQYNIFGFKDSVNPAMYTSFRLSRCFPSVNDKTWFLMIFSVSEELARKMEGQDEFFMDQLRTQIAKYAKISNLRIPLLRADYTSFGVNVMGLILDRPPALKQFWLEYEGHDANTNDPRLKVAPAADTLEKCAFACVDEGDFSCTGFFFCDKACFIKSKDILEPNDDDKDNFNFGNAGCQEWLRSEVDSTNKEAYLKDALKDLEEAELEGLIKVVVKIDDKTSVPASPTDLLIGEGPYTSKDKQDKPYDLKISFARLDPDDETTEQMTYIDTLNDCYMACKRSGDLDCASFSYCPDSSNKQCSLSSVLVRDRKTNINDVVDDKNCYVYSLKYLDFYQEYPGRIAMIPGEDVLKDIKSPEECAKNCRQAKDIDCRGFEFCYKTNNCILHSKHVLDLKPGEVVNTGKKQSCIHYAAKYTADYFDMGYVLIDDKNAQERKELTLEDCSKICSEELKEKCSSFNYCPVSSPGASDSTCELSALTLTSPHVTTTNRKTCHHYEKKSKVDDWGNASKKSLVNTGYTTSGFTWLVIGMLILGGALGALGFVVYSYYRSKSMDQGMTVRFMKNDKI